MRVEINPYGTPIYAVEAGTVRAIQSAGHGQKVEQGKALARVQFEGIEHPDTQPPLFDGAFRYETFARVTWGAGPWWMAGHGGPRWMARTPSTRA
ncbi:MAG TPA: hypothetical protein VF815_15190 [Myxococcaceae bacterium]